MRQLNLSLFLIVLIFISTASHASVINGTITGNVLSWNNAIPLSGGYSGSQRYKLSSASPVSNLSPTSEWIPGLLSSTSQDALSTITLNGPSNSSFTAPIKVVGVEYNTGTNSAGTGSDLDGGFYGLMPCIVFASGSTIRLIKPSATGTLNCIGKKYNAGGQTPFNFITPVIDVNQADFIQAFKDNKAVEGNYNGTLNFTLRYYYFTNQGIITYRNIPQQLAVQIYYKADYLEEVVLSPSMLVIEPDYSVNGKVSGTAKDISVSATGYFTTGLKMTFTAGAGSVFQMAGPDSKVLKYFIKCALCDQRVIVDNGILHADITNNNGLVTVPVSSSPNKIDFKLSVGYDAQEYDDVVTGNYTGSFIVIFEVDI